MANWAADFLQRNPGDVVMRAKRGLHVKRGSLIEASFTGAPCHYKDTDGLWKPLDTALKAASGGFYGAPGLDVLIHPDGRVTVEKSNYQQFTELPGKPVGKVDGDRVVREFTGGRQFLILTEKGFREEIILDKAPRSADAAKLVAAVAGSLPEKYAARKMSAVDADGKQYEHSTLTALRSFLTTAKYPVTLDPDFSIGNTNYGDSGFTSGDAPHWNKRRNYGATTQWGVTLYSQIIMRFDLSSVPVSATCTSSILKLTHVGGAKSNVREMVVYSISAANTDWIEGTQAGVQALSGEPCYECRKADGAGGVTEAWAGSEGLQTSGTDYESNSLYLGNWGPVGADPVQISCTFNATGIARVQQWFGGITYNYGLLFKSTVIYGDYTVALSEYATSDYRPILTVLYSAGVPKHFMYYARQRSQ